MARREQCGGQRRGNDGALLPGTGFAPGKVGQAFALDGVSGGVRIPAAPALNVGTGSGLTLAAWVRPTDVGHGHPVFEWSRNPGGAPYGVHLWVGHPSQAPGYCYANITDTAGNWHVIDQEGALVPGVFQHVAVTYDQASGVARLFVNGLVVHELNLGIFTPQTTYDLYLGLRPPGDTNSAVFAGLIDEASVYDRALAPAEVAAIYSAGSAGVCLSPAPPQITTQPIPRTNVVTSSLIFSVTATGPGPWSYQWRKEGQNLPGATNRLYVIAGVQTTRATTAWRSATPTARPSARMPCSPFGLLVPPHLLAGPVVNPANGHRYYLLNPSTWVEAEAAAVTLGGHLATVRNDAEENWIYATFSGVGGTNQSRSLLIGLCDPDPLHNAVDPLVRRSEFTWVSGEPVTYTHWADGEPNNWANWGNSGSISGVRAWAVPAVFGMTSGILISIRMHR